MRRIGRIAIWVVGILIGLPVALVLLVLVAANTGPGQRLIATEIGNLTGGMVKIAGIGGRFPDALHVGHIDINDAKGTWLSLDGVQLDWSPLALIGKTASIQTLTAERLAMPRLPAPSAPAKPAPPSKGGFSLPVTIDIAKLDVGRVELGAAVAGHATVLRLVGQAHIETLDDARATIAIDRLDGPGTYRLMARMDPAAIAAHLTAQEPAGGFVGGVAGLPDLGALAVDASIDGPRSAEKTVLSLSAGPLRLGAEGSIDLIGKSAALALTGSAPAMAPRPDLSWQSIALQANLHGSFIKPDVAAHATIAGLAGGGGHIASLTVDASGNQGAVDVHLVLDGVVLPPPKPDILAGGPLDLVAHIQLDQPSRPVTFTLTHPLVTADGTAQTGGDIAARLHVVVPQIAPLAALGGVDLQGRTEAVATLAMHGQDTDLTVDGTTGFTGGQAPVPTLLGPTTIGVSARLTGQDLRISRADILGRALKTSITGSDLQGKLDLAWTLALSDLSAASPAVIGALQASGRVQGPQTSMAVDADLTGDIGTRQIPKGPLKLTVRAGGLPSAPSGTIDAEGRFDNAPVTLQATVQKTADGAMHAFLKHAAWKSFTADADLGLAPAAKVPAGQVSFRMTRLADLAPLLGQPVAGALSATVVTTAGDHPNAKIDLSGTHVAIGPNGVGRITLTGNIADPVANPTVALTLAATGIAAGAITGDAHASARGPQGALALQADAQLHNVAGGEASLTTRLTLDAPRKQVVLSALDADVHDEKLHLVAPARIDFGSAVAVDRLRLALGQATIELAGKISPALALTASVRNVTPDLARPFAPTLQAAGVLAADAHLTGTPAAPQGSVRLTVEGLRMRSGPAASLPAANALVTVALQGKAAQINAHAAAGPKLDFAVSGDAPLGAGALALRALGKVDLTLLNPILGASGQHAAGTLALNGTIGGTTAAPVLGGALTLAGGEIQDYVQGARVHDINARIDATGDSIRIARFEGRAGDGTIGATGSVGVTAPGMPVDLHITASNARPLTSDRLTTILDANIAVTGQVATDMLVAGRVFLRRTDINIPDSFPPSVAKLDVRRPGYKPPPPGPVAPSAVVRLDLTIDAPNSIFVRGHGLDSELGGKLTVAGTAAAPQIGGGFEMRRGAISVAGTTLQFSKGEVSFNGAGVNNAIDPTLDFEADTTSAGVTATLAVTGYADAPKIKLSSSPDLPQDEVLAHLLFGTSIRNLSAIQIAEIGAAVAELSGVGGGGPGVLGSVRNSLGLDRLNVSGGSGTAGASVEAGRYVARGVYVGAKQATGGGGGTLAQVQIDLTKRLKATAQVGTGGGSVQGSTPENDTGSTIGLSYRFEY